MEVNIKDNNSKKDQIDVKSFMFDKIKPVKSFTGRSSELKNVYEAFKNHKVKPYLIAGPEGIGKTELAKKYAFDYCEEYNNNIIWINAASKESLNRSFYRLAKELQISVTVRNGDKSEKERDIDLIAKDIFSSVGNIKSLIIFDNAENFESLTEFLQYLSTSHILITSSNNNNWEGKVNQIKLNNLNETETLDFFKNSLRIKMKDNSSDGIIKHLAEKLQYFPLALGQAISYIKEINKELNTIGYKIFTISDYLNLYEETNKIKLPDLRTEHDRFINSMFRTWNITHKKIEENKDALKIIQILSYLNPDSININLFSSKLIKDKKELLKAVTLLRQYSIIFVQKGIISIHRMVQEVIRQQLKENGKEEEILRKTIELFGFSLNKFNRKEINDSQIISIWNYASDYPYLIDQLVYKYNDYTNKNTILHLFAKTDCCEVIKKILNHIKTNTPKMLNKFINSKNSFKKNCLSAAIEYNNEKNVELLKEYGADFYTEDLFFAIFSGYTNIIKILKLNNSEYLLYTDFYSVCKTNDVNMIENFLKELKEDQLKYIMKQRLAYINKKNKIFHYPSPLYMAASVGNLDIVKLLLNYNADINYRNYNENGGTPLYICTANGHLEIVKLLLEKCLNSNTDNFRYLALLHVSAEKGHLDIVKYLISNNIINVNTIDDYGTTPLHLASLSGKLNIVKYLLGNEIKERANLNAIGEHGLTPIFCAMLNCHSDIVKFLLNKYDVNIFSTIIQYYSTQSNIKFSVIHLAIAYDELEIVKKLIEKQGVDIINQKINEHKSITAIHIAAYYNSTETIKYFKQINVIFDEKFDKILKCSKKKSRKLFQCRSDSYFTIYKGMKYLNETVFRKLKLNT